MNWVVGCWDQWVTWRRAWASELTTTVGLPEPKRSMVSSEAWSGSSPGFQRPMTMRLYGEMGADSLADGSGL